MKYEINIQKLHETDKEFVFNVSVIGETNTEHQVELWHSDYLFLSGEQCSPEELVEKSFQFLLEKESNDQILPVFNLMEINQHFPEFEDTIIEQIG